VLTFRNGFADYGAAGSDVTFEGSDRTRPIATIAIATYKRPAFLLEATECVLAQRFDRPFEILIVDNDPESNCAETLLEKLPHLRERNFRYVVNRENLGAWGNFNRCITLARGDWVSILQDDDLLDANYLQLMFDAIDNDSSIDGVVCRKRYFDQHEGAEEYREDNSDLWTQRMSPSLLLNYALNGSARSELLQRIGRRIQVEHWFGRRSTRTISRKAFFWGPVLGNHGGFIFKRAAALDIGGFYAEDGVAGDQFFWLRFVSRYTLHQHREVAASIRIAENWSSQSSAHLSGMRGLRRLHLVLAGTWVPRWWLAFSPLILTRYDTEFQAGFHLNVPRADIEKETGARLSKDRPRLLALIRFVLGGSYP
jgi:glycosyltransferase involved in cell wall biosynthesis